MIGLAIYFLILGNFVDGFLLGKVLDSLPMLENVGHTTISIDYELNDESLHDYIEFCQKSELKIEFKDSDNCDEKVLKVTKDMKNQNGSLDFEYVKDPCMTYLVLLDQEEHLQNVLSNPRKNQAFVFGLVLNGNEGHLYEVQHYSKKIIHLCHWTADGIRMENVSRHSLLERRSDLGGSPIRFVQSPYFEYDGMHTAETMSLLEAKYNFTAIKASFEGYATLLPNGTWNGALRQLLDNEIDVASIKMTLTEDRRTVGHPGYVFESEGVLAMYKLQKGSLSWNLMLNVFDKHVYLVILAFILVFSFFLAFSRWTLFVPQKWFMALIYTSKSLFSQSFDEETFLECNSKWSKKLQIFCVSFLGVFMFWYWTGLLTSELTIPSAETPIQSLDDMNARNDLILMAYDGGILASYIYKWSERNAENKATFEKSIILVQDLEKITQEILKGKNVIRLTGELNLPAIHQELKNNHLSLCAFETIEMAEFGRNQLAWMYPTNSILKPLFDDFFHQLSETGIKKRNQESKKERFCKANNMIPVDIGFTTLIFIIIGLGTLISIVTFFIELALPVSSNSVTRPCRVAK